MFFSNFTGRVAKKAKVIDGVNGQFLSREHQGHLSVCRTSAEWPDGR